MLFVFNVPIVRAARLIKSKNGNIILVSNTVNWNFSSLAVNPGAISFTIKGLNKIPKRVIIPTTITIKVKRLFTICFVSSGFFLLEIPLRQVLLLMTLNLQQKVLLVNLVF